MVGVILTSPQCGGTHAFINFLRGLGLHLTDRHRDGLWYKSKVPKEEQIGVPITEGFDFQLRDGQFATGHSGPFPTKFPVICNLRDPRNIMICHWKRREQRVFPSFFQWLISEHGFTRAATIPRHWDWWGDNIMPVWYEDLPKKATQVRIAEFCGVEWQETHYYGHGRTWSQNPSDWRAVFNKDCHRVWSWMWRDITGDDWQFWWEQNGRDH